MRKKYFLLLSVLAVAVAISCNKSTALPVITPSPATIFTPGKLNHTKDSINVGDTVYLNAAGTVWDTTRTISVFLTANYGGPTAGTYIYGTVAAPIKVNRVIGALNSNGLYAWTATILLPGASAVTHKTTLAISATYVYQLSLSSQLPSSMSATDAGVKTKTVFVK